MERDERSAEGYIADFRRQMELRQALSQSLVLFAAAERLRKDLLHAHELTQPKQPLHWRLLGSIRTLLSSVGQRAPQSTSDISTDFDLSTYYILNEDGSIHSEVNTEIEKENPL